MTFLDLASPARLTVGFLASFCFLGSAAAAQGLEDRRQEAGRTAETGVGEVGQRQEVENPAINIEPMKRINNRIENRVRNRLDNRIDRKPDEEADTTSSFESANARARRASHLGSGSDRK